MTNQAHPPLQLQEQPLGPKERQLQQRLDQAPTKSKPRTARKDAEREAFKLWLATPSKLREPKEQQQLARAFGVDPATLSDWKLEPGFMDDVRKLAKRWGQQFLPDVIHAIVNAAKSDLGSAQDRKLFLQYLDDWIEKFEHDLPAGTVLFVRPEAHGGKQPKGSKAQASSG